MKRALAGVALVVLIVATVSLSPVSAQEDGISISVEIDDEEVANGERLEVERDEITANVTVRSENELNTLEARLHNKSVLLGINGTSHSEVYILEPRPGPNYYTVTATDVEGNRATSTANLYKEPVTAFELSRTVERIEREISSVEQETVALENNRDELEQTRQELQQRLNELENETDDGEGDGVSEDGNGGEGDGEGLPGFTVIAALLAGVLFLTYRRL